MKVTIGHNLLVLDVTLNSLHANHFQNLWDVVVVVVVVFTERRLLSFDQIAIFLIPWRARRFG